MKKKICAFIAALIAITMVLTTGVASGETMIKPDKMYEITRAGEKDSLPTFSPAKHGITIIKGIHLVMPMKMYLTFNSNGTITWTYDYYEVRDTAINTLRMYRIPDGEMFTRESEQYVIDGKPVYWSTEDDGDDLYYLYMYIKDDENNTNKLVGMFSLKDDYDDIRAQLYTVEEIHDGKYYFTETR